MRKIFIFGIISLVLCTQCLAEEIRATTEDGRNVVLKQDGTYVFTTQSKSLVKMPVKFIGATGEVNPAYINMETRERNKTILITLDFKNNSRKNVTGIIGTLLVFDGIGEEILKTEIKESINIPRGKRNGFVWKQTMTPEFSELYNVIYHGFGQFEFKILKAVFDDGTYLDARERGLYELKT